MKSFLIIFAAAVAAIATVFSNRSHATGAASTAATIITPIIIIKNADMNFGNIAVSASLPGTVVLDPNGSRTAEGAGGVTFPAMIGTISTADFKVSGTAYYTYAITLPGSTTISNGTSLMVVDNFTSTPSVSGRLDGTGTQYLKVGATLNISAAQEPGTYTNAGGFQVTVNYN